MIMRSLGQMRQSNRCGSVRNDEILNLHLGSGVVPGLSVPCLLQDTSYIHWLQDLAKRAIIDKILKDRDYEIATNRKYDGHQRGLESMVYKFFDKNIGSWASVNEELAEKLNKPVIKKFKRESIPGLKIIFGQQI